MDTVPLVWDCKRELTTKPQGIGCPAQKQLNVRPVTAHYALSLVIFEEHLRRGGAEP